MHGVHGAHVHERVNVQRAGPMREPLYLYSLHLPSALAC